jgi:SRSO17 transposase
VKRQYNGHRGKVENAVVTVAACFATGTFQSLMAARMYLPEEWAEDPVRRKKLTSLRRFSLPRNRKLLCS